MVPSSSDAVVQKAHGHAVLVELLDQPDHVSSVASQPVEFPNQDYVAIFHLLLQRVEARTLERTSAHLVGEDAVRFSRQLPAEREPDCPSAWRLVETRA